MLQAFNPLGFLLCLLLAQGVYLWSNPAWIGLVLILGLLICLGAMFIPALRIYALVSLLWLGVNQVPSFIGESAPMECMAQPQGVQAIAKSSSYSEEENLFLMQVQVHCGGKSYVYPWASIPKDQVKGWYLAGQEIELQLVSAEPRGLGLVLIAPKTVIARNLTQRDLNLSRGAFHYQLLAQGQYYLSGAARDLYLALALGHKEGMEPQLKQSIRLLGLSHLFAVSGMHIGILFLWIRWLLRRVMVIFPHLIAEGRLLLLFDLIALGFIYTYIGLLGQPVSALRSFEMLGYWVAIRHFMPWQPLWMALLFAADLTLLAQPWLIANLSFQLSFLSVSALFVILPLLPSPGQIWYKRALSWLLSSLVISGWLFAFTLPLILGLFGSLSLWAIPSNPLHIFLLALVFLPLALAVLAFNGVGLWLGGWPMPWLVYAPIQLMGSLWFKILQWNAELATWGSLNKIEPWGLTSLVCYWVVLVGLAQGLKRLKKV